MDEYGMSFGDDRVDREYPPPKQRKANDDANQRTQYDNEPLEW
jgi:hypothetical protein